MEIIRDILADVNVWSPGQTDPWLTYLLPVDGPKVGMGAAFWLIKLILANLSIFVTPALQLLRLRQAVPSTSLMSQTMTLAQWWVSNLPQTVGGYNEFVEHLPGYNTDGLISSNILSDPGPHLPQVKEVTHRKHSLTGEMLHT